MNPPDVYCPRCRAIMPATPAGWCTDCAALAEALAIFRGPDRRAESRQMALAGRAQANPSSTSSPSMSTID